MNSCRAWQALRRGFAGPGKPPSFLFLLFLFPSPHPLPFPLPALITLPSPTFLESPPQCPPPSGTGLRPQPRRSAPCLAPQQTRAPPALFPIPRTGAGALIVTSRGAGGRAHAPPATEATARSGGGGGFKDPNELSRHGASFQEFQLWLKALPCLTSVHIMLQLPLRTAGARPGQHSSIF